MIVNFAIESDGQLFVSRCHRLSARCEIDDREPPMAKIDTRPVVNPPAFAVRSTVCQRLDHPIEIRPFPGSHKSSNPAHRTKRKVALR